MPRILIIESFEAKVNNQLTTPSTVHLRNSFILKKILNANLITCTIEIGSVIKNNYDSIICVYSSRYMNYNKYMEILDNNKNAVIYWVVNEHNLHCNPLIFMYTKKYKRQFNIISNGKRSSYMLINSSLHGKCFNDWINDWIVININCLIFNVGVKHLQNGFFKKEKSSCIYFGTYRPGRILDMLDYNNCEYIISSSKKNHKKYASSGINAKFIDKLSWGENPNLLNFKYSIYFEDTHTHEYYEHMANRWYECLMCDVLLFFDYRCKLTIKNSNFKIDSYMIVNNGKELQKKINELDSNNEKYIELLNKQKENIEIAQKEKEDVIKKIKNIFIG